MMLELVELNRNHSHYAYNMHYAAGIIFFWLLYTVVVQLQFLRVIRNEEMMRSNKFQCLLCHGPNAIIMLVMSIMRIMRKPCEIMRELCKHYAEIM